MTSNRLPSGRVLIASNRPPVSARLDDGVVRLNVASGGLDTGLRRWHSASNGRWIGWPGDRFRTLPSGSLTVAVGTRPSHARFRVEDHRAVRSLLKSLIKSSGGRGPAEDGDRRADPFARYARQ